ncbi:hypothetical protein JTE90_027740 [Oedothorax gibbosus]|uniref:protein-histidine N-methyltransferase n=1 Tax=Oedothorax gibbosus TaxID=931172 RepID=A0AAV6UJX4_9ARAC|nr:hypothetical protein JTE90_027740 [Oedothorax gibbosus]
MTFRFNFSGSSSDETVTPPLIEKSISDYEQHQALSIKCEFINLENIKVKLPSSENVNVMKCAHMEIKYIKQNEVARLGELETIEEKKSDLVPGKYEGGLKVWECAIDLTQFLIENNCIQTGNTVLELGCGVGLPGIAAYIIGGIVTFQDFNSEVLECVTAPNVILNTIEEEKTSVSKKCQFICGDWQQMKHKYFCGKQKNNKYDYIITSETLYEKCNHRKLLDLMKAALKLDGIIYLASKVHYFGVGGGILDFEKLLAKDNTFDFSTVFRTEEGVERRILKLSFKNIM